VYVVKHLWSLVKNGFETALTRYHTTQLAYVNM